LLSYNKKNNCKKKIVGPNSVHESGHEFGLLTSAY
jgi:hypothetical protein